MHNLIGLAGYKGSGKSLASQYLFRKHEFINVKFAEGLKDMLRGLGLDNRHIEGELKEEPTALLNGKTPRFAMQTLGEEWGRQHFGDDFWINLWRQKVNSRLIRGINVVCDDVRYPNEVKAIHELGGVVWRIERFRPTSDNLHPSEAYIDSLPVDAVVGNRASKDAMYKILESLVFD